MTKEKTYEYWDQEEKNISNYITRLWEIPELPLMEYQSKTMLCEWLKQNGFVVREDFCGMPTAFQASYGKGKPVIGVLAEYDALAGLSNHAVPYFSPAENKAGHACLHCHIGAANIGAAIAAKKAMKEKGQAGTIVVIGCPAEELLYGKVALLDKGAFNGIDLLLTCHVDYQNAAVSRPTLSCFSGEFCFGGISSHTGKARAHNALDGVELAVASIERMRAHQFPGTSVEHVIRKGGQMPNITPDKASLWINVRDKKYETAREVYQYISQIIKDCAQIAGIDVVEGFLAGTRGYLPNSVLGKLLYKKLKEVGVNNYRQEDIEFMEKLAQNAVGNPGIDWDPEIKYLETGIDPYSQDDGEVSWHIPLGRVNWGLPVQIPLHNWCTTALAGKEFSHRGALMASKAIYLAIAELIKTPALVKEAEDERKSRIGGNVVAAPMYSSFYEMTKKPEAFWNGTWLYEKLDSNIRRSENG